MQLKSFLTLSAIVAASLLNAQKTVEVKPYDYARRSLSDPGYQIINRGEEYGMMDPNGKIIFDVEYRKVRNRADQFETEVEAGYAHNKAFALVNRAKKVGVIQNYKVVVPFEYDMIYIGQEVEDNVSVLKYVLVEKNGAVYRYDMAKGKQDPTVLGTKLYALYEEQAALVQKGNQVFTYDAVKGLMAIHDEDPYAYAMITHTDQYGIIDGEGNIIAPAQYDGIGTVSMKHNVICAERGGYYGAVNAQGKELIPFKYQYVFNLLAWDPETDKELACVEVTDDDLKAIYDTKGMRLTDFKYNYCNYAYKGYDDRYGIYLNLDKDGFYADFLEMDGTITPYTE